jgi:hypothetical protein
MSDCDKNFIFSHIIRDLMKKEISYNKVYTIDKCQYIIKKPKKK